MKNFFLMLLFLLLVSAGFSQETSLFPKWNIKLGHSMYKTGWFNTTETGIEYKYTSNFNVQLNYGINHWLAIGIYTGYSQNFLYMSQEQDYFYSLNCDISILPTLMSNPPNRLNLYGTAKFGGLYRSKPRYNPRQKHYVKYEAGLGVTYYIIRNLGLFADYSLGNFHSHIFLKPKSFSDNTMLRYGVCISF
jgi:hypothetical protein